MSEETALADLLAFVLARRPERMSDAIVAQLRPEERAALGQVAETVAALAVALTPVDAGSGLKDRIAATLRQKRGNPARRALVVCDMINDHLTPGRPLEVPRARGIVDSLARRIGEARASGVPVVYVLDRHTPDDPELDEWGAHALEGSEGAEVWPPLAPQSGDRIVTKASYSGFHGSDLERVLDDLAVDTMVLTGCSSEVQLLATATDALQRGFSVEMPVDSQAGNTETGEAVALGVVAALIPYEPARRQRLARIGERLGVSRP